MQRRQVLGMVGAIGGIAGCLGDSEDDADDAPPGTSDLPEETISLADEIGVAVEADRDVHQWRFAGDLYVLEFYGEHPPDDIPILGEAYAEGVTAGFDHQTMPTALDANDTIEYMVYIEVEWAQEWTDGALSDAEYYDLIAATIHGD